ncbi:MAG TPA: VWA domain-containing protein [Chloroflexota bacterium]|nr:VWA domain-containing protein [Chloroflexota bacterium]
MLALHFLSPQAFLLLAVVPLVLFIAWKSGVHMPKDRALFSLSLRIAVLGLLILAIASPRIVQRAESLSTVFLVDASDSVAGDQVNAEADWVRGALKHMAPKDQAGVVVFGANALVEEPMSHLEDLPRINSQPVKTRTDIAGAIRLGLALLPNTSARRMVILSDGNENVNKAIDQARLAGAAGVQIDYVPIAKNNDPEVYVKQVQSPATLREGETFSVTVTVESNIDTTAKIRLQTDGAVSTEDTVQVRKGANSYIFDHKPLDSGAHSFEATIEPAEDTVSENNQASAFSNVSGKPKVLIVEGQPGASGALAKALESDGTHVETVNPSGMPSDLPTLRNYDTLVLANVPADAITAAQMRIVKTYVQDLGGGLVVVGGNKSYGTGGYNQTPLEDVLPVTSEVAPRRNIPSTAVYFIIESLESNLGIDISREAAKASIQALSPLDEVGVSDGNQETAIPFQKVTNKPDLLAKVDALQMGDPASYKTFFDAAHTALLASSAKVKHIILLGDGDATENYEDQIKAIAADKITVSVVGTNVLPQDLQLLQNIAQWGNGRYYDGNDPFDIPRLLLRETQLVAKPAIVEENFQPLQTNVSPILNGIDTSKLPDLKGYVATTPKPTAQPILASAQGDPNQSEWQYGLGRVVAWTSDTKGQWAADWIAWPEFAKFWTQVIKRTLPGEIEQNLQTTIVSQGDKAQVTVDSQNADRQLQNFLTTKATVFAPGGADKNVINLEQIAPGRYQADFPAGQEGTYLVQVTQTNQQGQIVAAQSKGYVMPYSPEYQVLGTNVNLLQQLAAATGGRDLTDVAQAFNHDLAAAGGAQSIWQYLAAAALVLFLLDVASRRLRLAPSDLVLLWQILRSRYQRATPLAVSRLSTRGLSALEPVANFGDLANPEQFRRTPGAAKQVMPQPETLAAPREELASKDATRNRLFEAKRRAQEKRKA